MAITPVKIILFLAGGTVAAGGTAYLAGVLDPLLNSPPGVEATAPNAPKVAALPPSENSAASSAAGTEASTTSPAKTHGTEASGEPKVEVPSFDVVRVEPGGSIVIAGHAAANAKVEAIIGSRVIGSATAGPEGDFAIVLEKPLEPGDYSIVLRSTTADNVVAMSIETAVVSIPDTPAGQVLALVEEPGKPAQLITVPEPKGKPAAETAQPAVGSASANSDGAAASAKGTGAQQAVGSGEGTAKGGAPAQAEGQSAQKGDRVPQEAASAPEKPSVGEQNSGAQAPSEAGQTAGNESGTATKQPASQELASAGEEAKSSPATKPKAGDDPKVAVEAVEIEGRKIFVAGSATPDLNLRAYANEILLGDASASKAGRFLIETERELPVGDYIIRVDALGPDGVKVLARAAVPFEREAGENISAVAPSEPGNDTKPVSPGTSGPSSQESGSSQTDTQAAAGGSATSAGGSEAGPDASAGVGSQALPNKGSGAGEAQTQSDPQPPAHSQETASEQGASATAQPAETAAAGENMQSGTPSANAPKLQSVDGSVIIRRGDTLWRISKRVYGRGVRYSTIYLANQEQIHDPHKIWPGQVFKVPEKTGQGEKADMTRLGEQALKPPVTAQ
ncbi:LysM peptidoglycan-binding domain-containing protein [Pseudaminobacter soli (ex Zhang et al. 2022)]|uniref:LysM peptidoglycan-binding domain-containing protein n=1 Tax=Pseudaminobacter soli (ex Zhang et al. 2022) TaxID=2831468 RepID=UPI001F200312|nr:LysM peptidoglycan-binding domain-containing protein [Pseudaminobacter soli]